MPSHQFRNSKSIRKGGGKVGKLIVRFVAAVLATAGLIWLWVNVPDLIVQMFDMNLWAIKFAASLIPAPYGAMGEVALRGLGADRALIFAEGTLAVKLAFWLVARIFRRVPSQDVQPKKEV